MTETQSAWANSRELLGLMLILFVYLLAGYFVFLFPTFPRVTYTLAPGVVLLVLCGLWAMRHSLECLASPKGPGINRVIMGMVGLVALFALLRPENPFGEIMELGLILGLVVVVPLAEELFFRGFLFEHLQRNLGRVGALLLSAVLFGGLHHDHGYVVSMLVLGLLAGGALLATRSIVAPVAVHVCWNACAIMAEAEPTSRIHVLIVALVSLSLLYLFSRFTRKVSDESPTTEAVSPSA